MTKADCNFLRTHFSILIQWQDKFLSLSVKVYTKSNFSKVQFRSEKGQQKSIVFEYFTCLNTICDFCIWEKLYSVDGDTNEANPRSDYPTRASMNGCMSTETTLIPYTTHLPPPSTTHPSQPYTTHLPTDHHSRVGWGWVGGS